MQAGHRERRIRTISLGTVTGYQEVDQRRTRQQRYPGAAHSRARLHDRIGPILGVGDDGTEPQFLDIAGNRGRRLIRVDHRDRAARGDRPEHRCGVRHSVAHDEADPLGGADARVLERPGDRVGVLRDLVSAVPPLFELDTRPVPVLAQPGRQRVGEFGGGIGGDRCFPV